MATQLLATKLYIPPPRSKIVPRPRLLGRLNDALNRKLTLISAPAGFGKTTLVSEWILDSKQPTAWLSLDEGDNDVVRFISYLIAALQTTKAGIGESLLAALHTSQAQPPSTESILTTLLNEISTIPDHFVLVLDDYHLSDSQRVDQALTFLIEHLPPQMHLVIATREDPRVPLSRLRVRGQLTELRAADLRFTAAEAADFLNQVMGLNLSAEDIVALETRTEGWIAGLQLAALSMQGHQDVTSFIKSFTGSHRFVMDYLVEEVLRQQSEGVQSFLLRTSILDRMCSALCDAVLLDSSVSGQETLEYLEHANLFIVPLDNERHWFRYHHLLGDLLRKRLGQSLAPEEIARLHIHVSEWYENNDLMLEAFRHAAAAHDIDRAERLLAGKGIPLHYIGAVNSILAWLASLPKSVLDARPWLWVKSATSALMAGQTTGVEEKLQAAEAALAMQKSDLDDRTRDLIGQIAAIRATLALLRYEPEATIVQARRALEYLHPDNLPFQSRAIWTLGFAYKLQGERAAARQVLTQAIQQASGNTYYTVLATTSLGQIQESENELYEAAKTYRQSLQMLSDLGPPNASEEYIGLARICYEWNDLDAAEQYGQQSLQLSRQYDPTIDRYVGCEVFLARLKLARGDVVGAVAMLADAERSVCEHNFVQRISEVVAAQVVTFLRQGNLSIAAHLAQMYELPLSQARVFLSQGDPSAALAVLDPFGQQMEVKGWQDERLKVMVLQAAALHAHGEKDKALQVLEEALALAEPGGFIRIFLDEGESMRFLISDFKLQIEKQWRGQDRKLIVYVDKILAAFPPLESKTLAPHAHLPWYPAERSTVPGSAGVQNPKSKILVEPLSHRELEVLRLISQGLSNDAISKRLFLALSTVKGHNRIIFDKLHVQSRTEAVARARELGLL